jgi:molecular chaperone GrpE
MSQAPEDTGSEAANSGDDDVADRLAQSQEEAAGLKDKWLRAVADLDNYKKRTRREIEDAVFRARQDLLSSFFPTADNLDRALELARGDDNLFKGIEMVAREFKGALAKFGIEAVPGVGHPFDPAIHEALQQVDSPDHPPGVVVREFEKGYRQGDRLLRPARVIIAGPGSTGADLAQKPGEGSPSA